MSIYFFRLYQVITFGWKDSKSLAKECQQNRLSVYLDMIRCFFRYRLRSFQYAKELFCTLGTEQKEMLGMQYREKNLRFDTWMVDNYKNAKFLEKWKDYHWHTSGNRYHKRLMAYTSRYNMGKNCIIHYDVVLERNHGLNGCLQIGSNVLLGRHVYIDYSGDVTIQDNVKISAEVTIESHRHEFVPGSKEYIANPTKLVIEDGVWIGQKAIICEEVKYIGRYAQIGAGSVVRNAIPPYALVAGNPAKIVGFLYTPEEVEVFEREKYSGSERTDIERYRKQYDKYFINRISEIKKMLNN